MLRKHANISTCTRSITSLHSFWQAHFGMLASTPLSPQIGVNNCKKCFLLKKHPHIWRKCVPNIGGLRVLELPQMRGQRGEDYGDRPWFSPFLVKTIFFCVCWKSILRYVKDVSLTEPTLMGGPKGMRERCWVTVQYTGFRNIVIFSINILKIQKKKKFHEQKDLRIQFYICCAIFIRIGQKVSDSIVTWWRHYRKFHRKRPSL